ncbi:protocadherin alpha-8 isoform X1 [Eupeodes corollae]|uniref:protocadherin alpha-8 isoform X1 n=1 Tax=Eupeodes corollae TaxID=290404 RepID=UPI0024917B50|nr:protocadherin alpha-8 isoform X1 [Eupeodes corollae]
MWIVSQNWITTVAVGICLILQLEAAVESAILDSRCYLEGGGSAESFLASEDLEVGALIGKLRINGNPDEDLGDINLTLRERDAPVEIVPGSKNVVLAVELDKEGVKGPSSIYVNVICVRRHSTDPSFVIPVNVRVIDVNDNAPQWIGTPYTLTLSEVTVPGTRILQGARAADIDQQGPFSTVEYQVLPGPFSDYVQFLNPLEGTLVLRKPLDYEVMHNLTLKLRAQDQGTPPKFTDTMLRLVITDADDQNPKFLQESYQGELPTDGRPGELKIRPEAIKAVDQDEGICAPIQYSIVQSQDTKYFRIHPNTGAITLLANIGYSDLVNGATLVVKATQIDNPDKYALTTVTLSRPGTHSDMTTLAFVQKRFFMRIREDMLVGNRILALPTNKPGKHLRYYIPDAMQSQHFNVGTLGEVILQKPLDYEQATHHDFTVVATDGVANATAEVSLEVIDVNDWEPRFRETHYEFVVPKSSLRSRAESFDGIMIGKIEAADGDRNDKIELSLRGQHAGLFEIDSSGNLFIRPEMVLNESTIHIVAIATDSGVPPRSTSVPITVTMKGVALAQTSWASSILGMFGVLVGIFVLIILVLTCYIIRSKTKTKSPKSRNRVHSQGAVSSANLMTRPKVPSHNGLPRVKTTAGGNVTLTNPTTNGHGGSGSSLSAGASTILAASLEREAQRERERQRERDNYAATVRSIVSRASANGQLYDGEMERHSIAIHETVEHNLSENSSKKAAWEPHKSNLLSATEDMGSSENNLTVYF